MTKRKKILITLAIVTVIVLACILSFMFGFREGIQTGGLTNSTAEFMKINQHMNDQMSNANCEGVKQALNDYMNVLEKYKDVKGSFISDTEYYGDKMLIHVRLARIEKHIGNNAEAQQHMNIAKEACGHRQWTDCSEEKMILFAKKREENNPIACLSNEK